LEASWQRWIPLSGIIFVVLFVVALFVGTGPENENTMSNRELLDWYADHGHRVTMIVGTYLFAVSAMMLLLFVNRLRSAINSVEGASPLLAPTVLSGGVMLAVAIGAVAAAFAAVPAGISLGEEPQPESVDIVRFLPQFGFSLLLVGNMFAATLMLFGTAVATMRYRIFPLWFGWLSIICGLALFFSAAFFPIIALAVWVLVASVLLFNRRPAAVAV
jgi:hypothetical protein